MSSEVVSAKALVVSHALMGKKHYYSPHKVNKKELEEIGDSFLANGDGLFCEEHFQAHQFGFQIQGSFGNTKQP